MVTFRNNNTNVRRNNFRRNDRNFKSNGDKILSENYLQHADHFTRIMNEQDALKKERFAENKTPNKDSSLENKSIKIDEISKDKIDEKVKDSLETKKEKKLQPEVN